MRFLFYLFMKQRYDELSCLHTFLHINAALLFVAINVCIPSTVFLRREKLRDMNKKVQANKGIFTLNFSAHNTPDTLFFVVVECWHVNFEIVSDSSCPE